MYWSCLQCFSCTLPHMAGRVHKNLLIARSSPWSKMHKPSIRNIPANYLTKNSTPQSWNSRFEWHKCYLVPRNKFCTFAIDFFLQVSSKIRQACSFYKTIGEWCFESLSEPAKSCWCLDDASQQNKEDCSVLHLSSNFDQGCSTHRRICRKRKSNQTFQDRIRLM